MVPSARNVSMDEEGHLHLLSGLAMHLSAIDGPTGTFPLIIYFQVVDAICACNIFEY